MKRFKDSNGNIFIEINGKTYQLSTRNLDVVAFTNDKDWAKNVTIMRDEYARYTPNKEEF